MKIINIIILFCLLSTSLFAWEHTVEIKDGDTYITGHPTEEERLEADLHQQKRFEENSKYYKEQYSYKFAEYQFNEEQKTKRYEAELYARAMRDYLLATNNQSTTSNTISIQQFKKIQK